MGEELQALNLQKGTSDKWEYQVTRERKVSDWVDNIHDPVGQGNDQTAWTGVPKGNFQNELTMGLALAFSSIEFFQPVRERQLTEELKLHILFFGTECLQMTERKSKYKHPENKPTKKYLTQPIIIDHQLKKMGGIFERL